MCKYNKGFTLVELVIVIAVIGILAGLAIPHFLDSQAKTRTARAAADMRTLQSAVEQYMAAGNTIDGLTDDQKANGATSLDITYLTKDDINSANNGDSNSESTQK